MKRLALIRHLLLLVGVSVGAGSALPALAADSCAGGCPQPPKNSRAVSAVAVPLPTFCSVVTCPTPLLSATLANGEKKNILYVDGLLTDGPYDSLVGRAYVLDAEVNGLPMQPDGTGVTEVIEDCGSVRPDPDRNCTVVGQWWLDMDDPANAELLNVPLTVTLTGGDFLGAAAGTLVDISLRVRLEKK